MKKDFSLKGIITKFHGLIIKSIWNTGLRLKSEWEKEGKKCREKHKNDVKEI